MILGAHGDIQLRSCAGLRADALRDVHEAIFPIRFEDEYYKQLERGRFCTLGAFRGEKLVGIAVWEITSCWQAERLDGPLFSRLVGCGTPDAPCIYIMTLGVRAGLRRRGLGRALLDACVQSARALRGCVCLYLHVLTSNASAMRMYTEAHFIRLRTIDSYYPASTFVAPAAVDGHAAAAHVFARYLRNGVPPASLAVLRSWRLVCALVANALRVSGAGPVVDVFADEPSPPRDDGARSCASRCTLHRGVPAALVVPASPANSVRGHSRAAAAV